MKCLCVIVGAAVLGLASPAKAQPWAEGVSDEQKATAQALLEEGNNLFLANEHKEALAKYREAIEAWDHPAIRFNIVRILINLEKPLEAYENLEKTLEYGAAPLEENVYREAKNYESLLKGQIAELEVTCTQKGVEISVDGNAFLSCPGTKKTRMRPGNHAIVGKKKEYLTSTREVVLLPGKAESIDVELMSLDEATVKERRWAVWKPWAVTGGGAALAGIGVLLQLKAQSDFDQYGEEIATQCAETGCTEDEIAGSTKDLESRARLENQLAIGAMIAGGAAIVTGLTLVILNRERPVIPEERPAPSGPQVVPEVSANSVGVSILQRF